MICQKGKSHFSAKLQKIASYTSVRIRFRRWSRKGYAVFAGLNKAISIGQVSISICNRTMLKSERLLALPDAEQIYPNRNEPDNEKDDPAVNGCFSASELTTIAMRKTADVAACAIIHSIIYQTSSWSRTCFSTPTFLF